MKDCVIEWAIAILIFSIVFMIIGSFVICMLQEIGCVPDKRVQKDSITVCEICKRKIENEKNDTDNSAMRVGVNANSGDNFVI